MIFQMLLFFIAAEIFKTYNYNVNISKQLIQLLGIAIVKNDDKIDL
jgi:hypothetical protein